MKAKSPPPLQSFIAALTDREKIRFAKLARTTVGHLRQLAGGHRRASPDFARRLVKASARMFVDEPAKQLCLSDIRPDIWGVPFHPKTNVSARV